MKICVYCASSDKVDQIYLQEAKNLGKLLAKGGHSLVYGGGSIGLMGSLAKSIKAYGGYCLGVIPKALKKLELAYNSADKMIITEDLRERKGIMEKNADAFIALAGGYGTLEELLEVITLKKLKFLDKPIIIVNTDGYYHKFLEFLDFSIQKGFSPDQKLFEVANNSKEAMNFLSGEL